MTKEKVAKGQAVTAYKAFNQDWTCRGFQFEVGKTYEMDGPIVPCESGFHACTMPDDIWRYYDITTSKIARVTVVDPVSHGDDSKVAAAKITIEAELTLPEWLRETVRAITALCKPSAGNYAKNASAGDSATNASAGNSATNASAGNYAMNASAGHSATNASTGDYATNASAGDYATNASAGDYATNEAKGPNSVCAAAGFNSRAKVGLNGAIALAYWDGQRPRFAIGYAGEDGIKTDTWYEVRDGKLAEVQP